MTVTVARIERDVVTLRGPETLTYLQGQLSQDVAALAVGDVAWALLLQPQGKVDAWLRVDRAGVEEVRLDLDVGHGAAVVARLTRFLLRTRTEVELTADVPVLAVRGAEVDDGVPCGWPGLVGSDVFDPLPDVLPAGVPADAVVIGDEEHEALRIAAGVPAMGAEITPDTIPAELGPWLIGASVSFTKGCYTGQELVARIDSRGGNVPHPIRGLLVDGPAPAPGASVLDAAGSEVGTVTSSAVGLDGRTVALARLGRAVAVPSDASVEGVAATVVPLPVGSPGSAT